MKRRSRLLSLLATITGLIAGGLLHHISGQTGPALNFHPLFPILTGGLAALLLTLPAPKGE